MNTNTILPYIFDIEFSGKCNTDCSFCPRHEMKRGEEYMSPENFEHVFTRLKQYAKFLEGREVILPSERVKTVLGSGEQSPLRVILCGMGESLMNPHCFEWIARMRAEIGIRVSVVTNGLLLKPKNIERLAEAGITVVLVSVPGVDEVSYSRVMKIDFHRVLENIKNAHAVMPGRVQINATIPDNSTFGPEQIEALWGTLGIPIAGISHCHSRGGFLQDNSLTGRFGLSADTACGIIARHNFIAWDGRILSCCHDLHGENVVGHVSEIDFIEVARIKHPDVVTGPRYRICKNCNDGERLSLHQVIAAPLAPAATSPSRSLLHIL